jgi:hypothetical protein
VEAWETKQQEQSAAAAHYRSGGAHRDESPASARNPSPSSTVTSPIALRRSRAAGKLAAKAIQRQREGFLSGRPSNPFAQPARSSLGDNIDILLGAPPLSHEAAQSKKAWEQRIEVERVKKNVQLAEEQLRAQAVNPENPAFTSLASGSALQVAGIDPRLYRPPSTFSSVTQSVIHNPYYTEPSPLSGDPSRGHTNSVDDTAHENFLRRRPNGMGERAKREVQRIQEQVENNLAESFQKNMQQNPPPAGAASLSGSGNHMRTFSSLFTALRTNGSVDPLGRLSAETVSGHSGADTDGLTAPRSFLSIGDGVGAGALGSAGISDAILKRQLLEQFGAKKSGGGGVSPAAVSPKKHGAGGLSPSPLSPSRHQAISLPRDRPAYQHMEWTRLVGNNHSLGNLHAMNGGAGAGRKGDPSKEENPELERLRRSLPYAVRLSFRSSRIRVTAMHLAWLFGTMPGCTQVDEILFSPDMKDAYVAFQYCRYRHSEAALEAPPEVTGGRAGVECGGVEAVRLHLKILTADLPTPYLTAHRAHTSPMTGAQSGSSTAHLTLQGHAELRVLLRFLLTSTHVTEWSLVQLEALKRKWSEEKGALMPHVKDAAVLGPGETLPVESKQRDREEDSKQSTSSAPTAAATTIHPSMMSLDTSRMFSPRVHSGHHAVLTSRTTTRSSGASASGGTNAPAQAKPAGVPRKRRGKQPYGEPAALEWPEGMFAHVQQAQQQQALSSQNGGSQSARSSSAQAAPNSFDGGPSSSGAPTRVHDPRISIPDPRFFRSTGTMSSLRVQLNHPSAPAPIDPAEEASWMGRVIDVQEEQRRSEEREERERRYREARQAPVRNVFGEVSRANAKHRKKVAQQSGASTARLAENLTWSLTAQLEA